MKVKRVLSAMLCIAVFLLSIPFLPQNVSAATQPGFVTEEEVLAKLNDAIDKLSGHYFNKDNYNVACNHLKSDGTYKGSCSQCNSSDILAASNSWFRKLFNITTTKYSQSYNTYLDKMTNGYSCVGFANLMGWYLFQTSESDSINFETLSKGTFNKALFDDARPGDIVVLCYESGTHYHSVIFLSADDDGINVFDCNWDKCCKIQKHKIYYNNAKAKKAVVNRASNYVVEGRHRPDSCGLEHDNIDFSLGPVTDAIKNMDKIASKYNNWYWNCFDSMGVSGLSYYQYITWYIRNLAQRAGAGSIFSTSNDMSVFYKQMVENFGAKGYYIPDNCVSGYDKSPFEKATAVKWSEKDIQAGDILFIWDTGTDGTIMNFEHCYFVERVDGTTLYVTDGGIFDSDGNVQVRYDKTFGAITSTTTWLSQHLVAYLRPNYSALATVPISSITLSKLSATINIGMNDKLTVTYSPGNATETKEVTWNSSDTNVATVDPNGVVSAKAVGTTTITATLKSNSNVKATCKVTVDCPHVSTVVKNAKKETCGTDGYTGDTVCLSCNAGIKKGTVIAATGKHTYVSGKVTVEPTYEKEGAKTYICTVCGATKTESIPKLRSHKFSDEWTKDTSYHWHVCTVEGCGEAGGRSAHTAGKWIVDKEATLQSEGSRHKECITCGYVMITETIPKLVHTTNAIITDASLFTVENTREHIVMGIVTTTSEKTDIEYRGSIRDSLGNTKVVKDWTRNNEWLDIEPDTYGEYTLIAEARVVDNPASSKTVEEVIYFNPYIKGKCQLPYGMIVPGQPGYLIGVETYENPNQEYQYEMLILDCTLLAEGKDAWVYSTGKFTVSEGAAGWCVWQPQYGYYWTLFRVYDAEGNMIDQACYPFVNAY